MFYGFFCFMNIFLIICSSYTSTLWKQGANQKNDVTMEQKKLLLSIIRHEPNKLLLMSLSKDFANNFKEILSFKSHRVLRKYCRFNKWDYWRSEKSQGNIVPPKLEVALQTWFNLIFTWNFNIFDGVCLLHI
jgi:hypothetical protein